MRPMYRTKMVRDQEWKFILNETEPPELFRIGDGRPSERRNVAAAREHAGVRRRMERRLQQWWRW